MSSARDLQRNGLICDGLDHADGDEEDARNKEGEDECPDGETGVEDFNGDDGQHKGDEGKGCIPRKRDFWVDRHQARVHITLVLERAAELANDIIAVPDCKSKMSEQAQV